MVAVLGYSKEQILQAVNDMYTVVAQKPDTPLHFPIGPDACRKAGYDEGLLQGLPAAALESFAGVGNPFRANVIKPGDTVLDVGSGSGTDVLLAARLVGESGKVYAMDITPAMRDKLSALIKQHQLTNIEVLSGNAESIPLAEQSVDIVTSNGVLNLVPDKRKAINEIFRVTRPGGHVQIADIVIANPVTPDCEDDPRLWAECVVGATVDENYLEMFKDAGFNHVEILRDYDYFAYSPSRETQEVAKQFGAHAYELKMTRGPVATPVWQQWLKRANPSRLIRDLRKRGLLGMAGLLMALLACYGTLGIVFLMSVLGLTVLINEALWAFAIVAFAGLTTTVILAGVKKYKSWLPFIIAAAGTVLLIYIMFIHYSLSLELVGFALLALAVWLDYWYRRWAAVPVEKKRSGSLTPMHYFTDRLFGKQSVAKMNRKSDQF